MTEARAGLPRRLAAAAYDGLLVIALLLVYSALLLPFSGGEAITVDRFGALAYAYHAGSALIVAGYFGLSWRRRGQTLGMKAWRLRLAAAGGTSPDWRAIAARLLCAATLYLLALGGLLMHAAHRAGTAAALAALLPLAASLGLELVTGSGTLEDRASRTRVVLEPRRSR
ncbi:MAG: RDD family protein [Proteobacteria bacterium]|nr:RDD family protein [Pseudomonadota bacterium]